jgi:PAS domain S-box-containing protein
MPFDDLSRQRYPPPMSGTLPDPAQILDLLLDTVFVLDPHGRVLYASASCEALLGYTPAELVGTYMVELVHPDDRGKTLSSVWRVMSGEAITRFENRWIHKLGHSVPIQWSARWDAQHQVRVAVGRRLPVDWAAL